MFYPSHQLVPSILSPKEYRRIKSASTARKLLNKKLFSTSDKTPIIIFVNDLEFGIGIVG
ncbi:MAG: hypothetical protein ACD_11C00073G0002 [uncultured bacterium]|nr:MAG: hypothetical protein ACD_11C00073G0002 [uncultured bacterium]